eukprot:GHVT01040355.1.p1 GENE.GHVT01040355.1~~GHVT01040355.1.p1  ORF type:complete len:310 (+),score=13.60 GHVT01040355.1:736-1665(+)
MCNIAFSMIHLMWGALHSCQVVVLHDGDMCRISGQKSHVREMPFCRLPNVLDSTNLAKGHFDFIEKHDGFPMPFECQPVPKLQEIFDAFPNTMISVDIKEMYPAAQKCITKTLDLVREYNRLDKTIFGGFDQRILNAIRMNEPEAMLAIGPQRAALYFIAFMLNLLWLVPIWETAWLFPACDSWSICTADEISGAVARKIERLCTTFLGLSLSGKLRLASETFLKKKLLRFLRWMLRHKGFITALKRRGLCCHGWVCNSREEFSQVFEMGCDGVITDYPKMLREYLQESLPETQDGGKNGDPTKGKKGQ